MTIELQTPHGEIQDWLIDDVKKKILALHHKNHAISHARIYFKHRQVAFNGEYVCEIDLTVHGSSLMVQRGAASYMTAADATLAELNRLNEQIIAKKESVV